MTILSVGISFAFIGRFMFMFMLIDDDMSLYKMFGSKKIYTGAHLIYSLRS